MSLLSSKRNFTAKDRAGDQLCAASARLGATEDWILRMAVHSASVRIGFLVRVILRKNCTDLEFRPALAGLHVIKAKGLIDTARRSNSVYRVTVESDFPCSFYGKT
jgi:hypothetical protein